MHLDDYVECFDGSTDIDYLRNHYQRFALTKKLAYQDWHWEKANILDIGAHWLHQPILYALDGHKLTAADFPITLNDPVVKKLATKYNIDLLVYDNLSTESVFDEIKDNSMDVILFAEILEHITFNPVAMWKAIYRILKPGGRIIVTTPNYYRAAAFFPGMIRTLSGSGGGISVNDILTKHTHAPHWKEFSAKELKAYFSALSADFSINKLHYFSYETGSVKLNWKGKTVKKAKNIIPVLRKAIYIEIDLKQKESGINVVSDW